jgi:hypothetical protein
MKEDTILSLNEIEDKCVNYKRNNVEFRVQNESWYYIRKLAKQSAKMETQIVILSFLVIVVNYLDRTNISTAIVEMQGN